MKNGVVFGKFIPPHKGHLALIDFALRNCDHLYVIICYTSSEPIDGLMRTRWLSEAFQHSTKISLIPFHYDESVLANTSVSSREVSKAWAFAFKRLLPAVEVVFTSEKYGDYVAEYMNIEHIQFDQERLAVPISASAIRNNPILHWDHILREARYWFITKIALVGSESTGKSTLTRLLAKHFNTIYVPEMAREIIEKTDECTYEDLHKIAHLHASTILAELPKANKLLFVDTDVTVTESYAGFLFKKELTVDAWITSANRFDLFLFLEPDCEYVQDGTRLNQKERMDLSIHHKQMFEKKNLPIICIKGDWDERLKKAIEAVNDHINKKPDQK